MFSTTFNFLTISEKSPANSRFQQIALIPS
jgi:hypothetical protein